MSKALQDAALSAFWCAVQCLRGEPRSPQLCQQLRQLTRACLVLTHCRSIKAKERKVRQEQRAEVRGSLSSAVLRTPGRTHDARSLQNSALS